MERFPVLHGYKLGTILLYRGGKRGQERGKRENRKKGRRKAKNGGKYESGHSWSQFVGWLCMVIDGSGLFRKGRRPMSEKTTGKFALFLV